MDRFRPFFLRIYRATNVHLFSFSKSSMPTDLPTVGWKKNNQKQLGIHSKKVTIDMDFESNSFSLVENMVVNLNLGCPAGALPSVHLICHSPEGMLEKLQDVRKHTQKISETHCCEHCESRLLRWHRLLHCKHCRQFSVFFRGGFSGCLTFVIRKRSRVATSLGEKNFHRRQAEIEREKSELPTIRSLHQKLVSYSPVATKILQKSTCIGSHNLHISFTFSPGFVESAVWPHQEFRDRDPKKEAVLPGSSTGSCGPCSYQEDHQALAINHDSVRTSFTKTICFTNNKLMIMIMMKNEVKF